MIFYKWQFRQRMSPISLVCRCACFTLETLVSKRMAISFLKGTVLLSLHLGQQLPAEEDDAAVSGNKPARQIRHVELQSRLPGRCIQSATGTV